MKYEIENYSTNSTSKTRFVSFYMCIDFLAIHVSTNLSKYRLLSLYMGIRQCSRCCYVRTIESRICKISFQPISSLDDYGLSFNSLSI